MSSGMYIATPPSASTTLMKPAKSTTTKSSMYRPVSSSTAMMVQAAAVPMSPPSEPVSKAELNITSFCGSVVVPSPRVQAGMSTRVSRGIETTSTRERSAEMWASIVVSERMPLVVPVAPAPSTSFSPSRESEPMTRRLSARPSLMSVGGGVPDCVGRLVPRRSSMSWVSMFWFTLPKVRPTTLVAKARTNTRATATVRPSGCERRRRT